jgi:DNA-binding CsgD family transcriptional regulator
MSVINAKRDQLLSKVSFAFLFAYILSFLFEGQVMYSLLESFDSYDANFILIPILFHMLGLFLPAFMIKNKLVAKNVMIFSMLFAIVATIPFLFVQSSLWYIYLPIAGFSVGASVSAWGYFLKIYTQKNERVKTCADVLILSNIIMIIINLIAIHVSPVVGLLLSMMCLIISIVATYLLPLNSNQEPEMFEASHEGTLTKTIITLFVFISVLTINAGLMYQVIGPAFDHLISLVSWYWAVPYIIALLFMRNYPLKNGRSVFLYIGIIMMLSAFIAFMILGRTSLDYIIVDTLLLFALGIFDLFWWSIIGEMLSYTGNPAKIFGLGLTANVLGVLVGDILGVSILSIGLQRAETVVIALSVIVITLMLLPRLNRQLKVLLQSHAYLNEFENMSEKQQNVVISQVEPIEKLTAREEEVLQLILAGKSNKELAEKLFISESTVKTHTHNIYSKYDVRGRAELISLILSS